MAEQYGKALVPQIRFAGFTDPWEQRKLGELIQLGGSGGTPSATNPSYYGGEIPFLSIADIEGRDITHTAKTLTEEGLKNSAAWIVPAGAVSLAMYASVGKVGIIRQNTATSQAFYNMVFDNAAIRDFVFTRLEKADMDSEWEPYISTGTQRNLNADKVKAFALLIPEVNEAANISRYFRQLDSLITLHQRKYDKLCVLKKSMLDKMFPKGGSLYPEIRFAGFTDPWEQRKLGDVATIVGGGTPSTNNDAYWDGDIDWYSPAELGEQVYADRSVRRITQAGYDSCSATLLPAGKTILFTSRAGIGNTAILRRSACTNQGFQSLVVNDDTDVYFIYSMTDRIKNFAEQKASGSTFLEISGKGLAAGEFAFPSKDEQTAIGSMFKQLDHLITLHQRKLELLRNIKKSMLDKMFV
ncbi:restriction endonuclease subunit S [uncultured Bifidobacterium sp.]|uniref:restriction endonuclease subunit S n=1 Tax=uncultured Bifidobacterium sp. TaxID=165187 RepID=UPI00258F687D|nr:restriction endonuclease subunit S [uncultured Bifidobacterium sp.]